MPSLPSDRTKLALAQSNQNPGNVLGSSQNKNALTEAYDTIDALFNYTTGLINAGTLSRLGIFNVLDYGAKSDGVVDCYAAYNSAKVAAGSSGVVVFPQNSAANAVYYFATMPNLNSVVIDCDDGVIFSVPSTNGLTFGATKIRRNLKITSRDRNNTGELPATVPNLEWINVLPVGDISKPTGIQNPIASDATTFVKKQYDTNTETVVTGVSTLTSSRQVDWTLNAIGSTVAGKVDVVQCPAVVGKEYLASFKAPTGGASIPRGGILIACGGEWAYFSILCDATKTCYLGIKKQGIAWAETTQKTLPSGAYTIQPTAQPIISARIISLTEVEFYINGMFVVKYTSASSIKTVGFGWNGAINTVSALTCYDFIEADTPERSASINPNIAIFGDSISFGEGSNLPWPDILKNTLRGMNGIADVTITNNAVSGQNAAQQLAVMQGKTLTAFDYVLIMVGTNDIQGQTAYATYRQNLLDMITKVRADGSIPILGIPPMFIDSASTGYGFATSNYGQGGVYRSTVFRVAAEQSVTVADVCTDFGNIGATNTQLRDNIHPKSFADTYIARSFASAILSLQKGRQVTILPSTTKEGGHIITWGTALPTAGYRIVADIHYNATPTVLGAAASQYTVLGWRKITSGDTNVLNTDWVEMRQLTGT